MCGAGSVTRSQYCPRGAGPGGSPTSEATQDEDAGTGSRPARRWKEPGPEASATTTGVGSTHQGNGTWPRCRPEDDDVQGAPGATRTHTARVLNPLPLPIGVRGRAGVTGCPSSLAVRCCGPDVARLRTVSSETIRVIIAEDEALIRLDLKEMLEEEGYSVVAEVGDGQQAVDRATELRPDLVILDIQMPVLDGLSAAEQIASARVAPVIVLTADRKSVV